jgi:hypothetical protein
MVSRSGGKAKSRRGRLLHRCEIVSLHFSLHETSRCVAKPRCVRCEKRQRLAESDAGLRSFGLSDFRTKSYTIFSANNNTDYTNDEQRTVHCFAGIFENNPHLSLV